MVSGACAAALRGEPRLTTLLHLQANSASTSAAKFARERVLLRGDSINRFFAEISLATQFLPLKSKRGGNTHGLSTCKYARAFKMSGVQVFSILASGF